MTARAAVVSMLMLAAFGAAAQSPGTEPSASRAVKPETEAGNDSLHTRVEDSAVTGTDAATRRMRAAAPADTLDLGTTSITGNQELPKVLYIVPWKRADLGDVAGRPVDTLLDEVLAPVDPQEFERHLAYYTSLYGDGPAEAVRSEKE